MDSMGKLFKRGWRDSLVGNGMRGHNDFFLLLDGHTVFPENPERK
jgi:hypothetical protein